ncbi:MAG: nitroreductase family protein [Planctomycetes bacterium]|nr:nitroreductase family protein [Planctomycetota bacterium]
MDSHQTIPLEFLRLPEEEMCRRALLHAQALAERRSVRNFSADPIPLDAVRSCIQVAASAPSGAHKQPWHFVLVTDPTLKREIRLAAEVEERENYQGRMNPQWIEDLEPLGTDHDKPFLEDAPCLIVVFREAWGEDEEGQRRQHYYTQESVGIAAGFLLGALHLAGLATLTHTPSPMGFLGTLLEQPERMKAFLLIPVGYPVEDCRVPDLQRKPLDTVMSQDLEG